MCLGWVGEGCLWPIVYSSGPGLVLGYTVAFYMLRMFVLVINPDLLDLHKFDMTGRHSIMVSQSMGQRGPPRTLTIL